MADSTVPTPDGHRFARRVVIAVTIGIGGVALALFLWYAMYVLLLAFAGVLVAVALRGMSLAVARWTGLKVGAALAVTLLLIVTALVALGWMLAPSVARQVDDFSAQVPSAVASFEDRVANYEWGRQLLGRTKPPSPVGAEGDGGSADPPPPAPAPRPTTQGADAPPMTQPAQGGLANAVEPASVVRIGTRYAALLLQAVVAALVVLVVGTYLAADPHLYERGALELLPHAYRRRVSGVLCECSDVLQKWMTAQLIPMSFVGCATALGLWALGIKLWLTIGLLAAACNFIPNFGPLISFVPATLFALAEGGPHKALGVVALYLAAQGFEGYVLTPMVQGRASKLPPVVTILVQVLMGLLMGGIGVVLAAPLAAAAIVIVKRMYVEDVLGDVAGEGPPLAQGTETGRADPNGA